MAIRKLPPVNREDAAHTMAEFQVFNEKML
jgi:hypothetical protein